MSYIDEFIFLGAISLLGAISPGPDFAVITQSSLREGRKAGIYTTLGVTAGCFIHVTYCVLAVDFVAERAANLFSVMKYIGAAYLIYLGIKGLMAKPVSQEILANPTTQSCGSVLAAFKRGFLVNILNPKVILFFMSMFTLVIDRQTPRWIQMLYGIEFCLIGFIWFATLTMILNYPQLKMRLLSIQHWVERCLGVFLIVLGLKIATFTQG
jgi:RhtB (resistance to homoserine/threonine) family protein